MAGDGGGLGLTPAASEVVAPVGLSLSDPQAITSDVLALICKQPGLLVAGRKQERIDALAAHLASASGRVAVRASLSQAALPCSTGWPSVPARPLCRRWPSACRLVT